MAKGEGGGSSDLRFDISEAGKKKDEGERMKKCPKPRRSHIGRDSGGGGCEKGFSHQESSHQGFSHQEFSHQDGPAERELGRYPSIDRRDSEAL